MSAQTACFLFEQYRAEDSTRAWRTGQDPKLSWLRMAGIKAGIKAGRKTGRKAGRKTGATPWQRRRAQRLVRAELALRVCLRT